jgi:uncharacterized protein (DUF58 family)
MGKAEGRVQIGLTDAGKVILRGIIFIAFATVMIPAFDVLSVLICVMLVALVVGIILRPKILVTGNLPERIVAGQTAHLTYTIQNTGRLPGYHLRVRFRALPDAIEQMADAEMVWRLAPGQTAQVVVDLRPKRRGHYHLRPPVCESSFPFNLFYFGTPRDGMETLVVLPVFTRQDLPLPCVSRHVDAGSLQPAGRVGTAPEYIGNRPYQPGDPPRRIDVRAWARLSVPATKEYDDDLDTYAGLVLDTRAPEGWSKSKSPEVKELEAAVSLCASVASAVHRDCQIDLLLAGGDLHSFASLPKATCLDRVHEALAAVEPSEDYTAEQIGPLLEDRLGEISEIIFIVLRWDRTYQQLAQWAELAGCHCTVLVVGEGLPNAEFRVGDPEPDPQAEDRGQRTEDGAGTTLPSFDVRFIPADDILAGRRASL